MDLLAWVVGLGLLVWLASDAPPKKQRLTDDEILARRRRAAIDKANAEQDRRERKRMQSIDTAYHLDREVRWHEWN
jgi:hypothetical protein